MIFAPVGYGLAAALFAALAVLSITSWRGRGAGGSSLPAVQPKLASQRGPWAQPLPAADVSPSAPF